MTSVRATGRSWFRPSLVGTVAMIFVAVVCIRLGFWQLARYDQREGEMATRRALHGQPPLTSLDGDLDSDYRRTSLTGRFRPEARLVAGGIPYGRNGYALVGTLELEEGPALMVLRGWVPSGSSAEYTTLGAESVTVSGVLRRIEPGPEVQPVPRETGELWPLEPERFLGPLVRGRKIPWSSLRAATSGDVAEVYLMEGEELADNEDRNVNILPASGYAITRRTVHHIEYAVQWFAFAAIAVGIWGLLGWRRARSLSQRDLPAAST